jgi:hypothetical protein
MSGPTRCKDCEHKRTLERYPLKLGAGPRIWYSGLTGWSGITYA